MGLMRVTEVRTAWNNASNAQVAAQAAAQRASQNKEKSRAAFEAVLRTLTQRLQASPTVTDAQAAMLKHRTDRGCRTN